MAPTKEEVQERKDWILGITVKQYIKTVSPVSSSIIVREYPVDLSPATIRAILAELEDLGYLTHPHTSAGRVPTQKGYRYYVDYIMDEINLLEAEKTRIKQEYIKEKMELEKLLEKTSEALSEITHYTGIVSVDGMEDKLFLRGTNHVIEYPDSQEIEKIGHILSALDKKHQLLEVINQELNQRIEILIGQEIECSEINSCSLAISKFKTKKGPSGRLAILGPTRMDYQRVVSALDYFSNLMEEVL